MKKTKTKQKRTRRAVTTGEMVKCGYSKCNKTFKQQGKVGCRTEKRFCSNACRVNAFQQDNQRKVDVLIERYVPDEIICDHCGKPFPMEELHACWIHDETGQIGDGLFCCDCMNSFKIAGDGIFKCEKCINIKRNIKGNKHILMTGVEPIPPKPEGRAVSGLQRFYKGGLHYV